MVYINQKYITSDETIQHIIKKMTPPLGKIKKKKKKKKNKNTYKKKKKKKKKKKNIIIDL